MLEHFFQVPTLQLAERLGFRDEHLVTDLRLLVFIVRIELGGLADDLLEAGMRNAPSAGTATSRRKPVAGFSTTTVEPAAACPKTLPDALCARTGPVKHMPSATVSALRRNTCCICCLFATNRPLSFG